MAFEEYGKGDRIGSVEVLDIKEGGLGRLYFGYCYDRQIKVAIKTIRRRIWEEYGLDTHWRAARDSVDRNPDEIDIGKYIYHIFVREARLLCQARNHPNVLHGTRLWYAQSGQPFFECEYVSDSTDLGEFLQSLRSEGAGPLSCLEAVHIAVSFCNGMIYISDKMLDEHNRLHPDNPALGFVHRDIKPENIMLNRQNQPKIIDLGLAKYILTRTPTSVFNKPIAVGSHRYISPEQRENYDAVLPSSDIFSFGVVLYEMLGGDMPWQIGQDLRLPARVPDRLREIIARCLERESGRRYQRFQELKEALGRFVAEVKSGRLALPERYRCRECGYVSAQTEFADIRVEPPAPVRNDRGATGGKAVVDRIAELLGGASAGSVPPTPKAPPAPGGKSDPMHDLEVLLRQPSAARPAKPAAPSSGQADILRRMQEMLGGTAAAADTMGERKPATAPLSDRTQMGICPLCHGGLIEFSPADLKVPEKSVYTWAGYFDIA